MRQNQQKYSTLAQVTSSENSEYVSKIEVSMEQNLSADMVHNIECNFLQDH